MNKHGGYFGNKKEVIDFSININPIGISNEVKNVIVKSLDHIGRYPEIDGMTAKKSIAEYEAAHVDHLILGNGAAELIYLYARALKPKKVLIIQPTFNEYKRAFKVVGSEIYECIMDKANDFLMDTHKIIDAIKEIKPDVLVFCNPNNPTGRYTSRQDFQPIVEALDETNASIFIDESFIDFSGLPSYKPYIENQPVFILRSMTKYFAVPGMRLGYGIGNKTIIRKMAAIKEPWTLNCFALNSVDALIHDKDYILRTKQWFETEKRWMYESLKKIKNLHVIESHTNFFLCQLLNHTSKEIQEKILQEDIYIRTCEDFTGLDDTYIRLAVKEREDNVKLIPCLEYALMI
ncbi:MAG: aminotransferase class I/II-fold pyridoxal phosphate-dependent enzyme [Clostridia bacterium]|nr:aminotransferase class I/II-fold pyridoxal phosphate-dependent enzyme [Clostridia bacterium]